MAQPEIKVITKIEHPVPPAVLLEACNPAPAIRFERTSDIVASRNNWMRSWEACYSKQQRLSNWVKSVSEPDNLQK